MRFQPPPAARTSAPYDPHPHPWPVAGGAVLTVALIVGLAAALLRLPPEQPPHRPESPAVTSCQAAPTMGPDHTTDRSASNSAPHCHVNNTTQ